MTHPLRLSSDGHRALPKRISFTEAAIQRLAPPTDKPQALIYDTRVPKLALMIGRTGSKVFYWYGRVQGEHKPIRFPIGNASDFSVDSARTEAMRIGVEAAKGINPLRQRQEARAKARATVLLGTLWNEYLAKHLKVRATDNTIRSDTSLYNTTLAAWKGRAVDSITEQDCRALHTKIGADCGHRAKDKKARSGDGHRTANRAMQLLRRLYRWARLPSPIPEGAIDWFDEPERDRFLLPDEMQRYIAAVEQEPDEALRDYLLLSLFTGARKGSLSAMEWSEIDFGAGLWTIPADKSKSRRPVALPLAPEAIKILKRRLKDQTADSKREKREPTQWVFPARSRHSKSGHITQPRYAHDRACKLAGIDDLHLHDLRRTAAAYQAASGASLIHIAKALGHTGTQATGIYARLQTEAVRETVTKGVSAMMKAMKPKQKRKV